MLDEKRKASTEVLSQKNEPKRLPTAEESFFGTAVEFPKAPEKSFYARMRVEANRALAGIEQHHPLCADLFRQTLSANIDTLDPDTAEGRLGAYDPSFFEAQLTKANMTLGLFRQMEHEPSALKLIVQSHVVTFQEQLKIAKAQWEKEGRPDLEEYSKPEAIKKVVTLDEFHKVAAVYAYRKKAAELQTAFAAAKEVGLAAES